MEMEVFQYSSWDPIVQIIVPCRSDQTKSRAPNHILSMGYKYKTKRNFLVSTPEIRLCSDTLKILSFSYFG